MAPCPPLETVVWHDLFLGRPRSRRYPKFNIRRDIPAENVLKGNYPNHPAIATLRADHTGFDPKTLARSLKVLDYRYRIELQKSNRAVFEMSLDQVRTTTLADGMTKTTYEAELEIVKDNFDEEDVEELFRLVKELEKKYNLKPSTKTKGGIEVPEASSPSHP